MSAAILLPVQPRIQIWDRERFLVPKYKIRVSRIECVAVVLKCRFVLWSGMTNLSWVKPRSHNLSQQGTVCRSVVILHPDKTKILYQSPYRLNTAEIKSNGMPASRDLMSKLAEDISRSHAKSGVWRRQFSVSQNFSLRLKDKLKTSTDHMALSKTMYYTVTMRLVYENIVAVKEQ